MLLFKKEFDEAIISGEKEWTIRKGDRTHRLKVGAVHSCKHSFYEKPSFAHIRIMEIILKKFKDLTEKDAKNDNFKNLAECRKKLIEINGEISPDQTMTLIHFKKL